MSDNKKEPEGAGLEYIEYSSTPLDETNLDVVRGLIKPRGFGQCVIKENLSERWN